MTSPTKWITVANGGLGLWLLVAPFVLGAPPLDLWNDVIVGGGIVALSGYNFSRERATGGRDQRISGGLVLLGGWLLLAPFVVDVAGVLRWNDVVVGVFVTAFAGYNVYVAPLVERTVNRTTTDET